MTVEKAQAEAERILGEFASGANPAEARRTFKTELTLTEFFTEYGTRHGEKLVVWRDMQQRFRDYLQKPLGDRKLTRITRAMIARALSDIEKAGKASRWQAEREAVTASCKPTNCPASFNRWRKNRVSPNQPTRLHCKSGTVLARASNQWSGNVFDDLGFLPKEAVL
jgi:integrase